MTKPEPRPLAADLNVLTVDVDAEPVTRDQVEGALYALTGWQKPQHLVDTAMTVIDSYATGVKRGVVPARPGHPVARCSREHLDDHVCEAPVDVTGVVTTACTLATGCRDATRCAHGCSAAADELTRLFQETEVAPSEPEQKVETTPAKVRDEVERTASGKRTVASMTPEQLLAVKSTDLDGLTLAQRTARHVLTMGEQKCSRCGMVLPLTGFHRDKARLTGRASRCKNCHNMLSNSRKKAKRREKWNVENNQDI